LRHSVCVNVILRICECSSLLVIFLDIRCTELVSQLRFCFLFYNNYLLCDTLKRQYCFFLQEQFSLGVVLFMDYTYWLSLVNCL